MQVNVLGIIDVECLDSDADGLLEIGASGVQLTAVEVPALMMDERGLDIEA